MNTSSYNTKICIKRPFADSDPGGGVTHPPPAARGARGDTLVLPQGQDLPAGISTTTQCYF